VIAPNPPASGADGAVAAYEELRSYILAGSPSSRHFGLVLLLREGIAARIERCAARSAPAARSAALDHAVSAPLASQQLHADMVRVLASIALTGREEMKR
jgi:recombinational DNA repair protein (RecF pathway)